MYLPTAMVIKLTNWLVNLYDSQGKKFATKPFLHKLG